MCRLSWKEVNQSKIYNVHVRSEFEDEVEGVTVRQMQ